MKLKSIIWGLVFIVVGTIIALNEFGVTDVDIFFNGWWTLFIIIPCFVNIFATRDKVGNFIGLVVGVALFLVCNDFIDFDVLGKLMIPFILVGIGLCIIFKNSGDEYKKHEAKHLNTKDEITAVFREDITKAPKTFEGVKLESVFGSIQYDLSSSSIKKDALVTASAVFGSVKIKVPKDVEVKFRKNAIFGDAIDRTEEKDSKSTIYVDANAVFGSVIVDDN
jgi:predicted membrane protein